MPKTTFYNLSDNKKESILVSAKKEFSRVPFNEASIQKIVEDAGISRGSFYQYFESKEDLFDLVFESIGSFKAFLFEKLEEDKIDLFDLNQDIFNYLIDKSYEEDNLDFIKKMFHNMKVSDVDFLKMNQDIDSIHQKYFNKVDTSKLNIESIEDIKRLNKILLFVLRGSLATSFSFSKEKAKKEYEETLKLLRKSFEKEREEIC